jgi:putative transposase
MSIKRKTYTADFKAKVVLELIEGQTSLNEIASKYELLPKVAVAVGRSPNFL